MEPKSFTRRAEALASSAFSSLHSPIPDYRTELSARLCEPQQCSRPGDELSFDPKTRLTILECSERSTEISSSIVWPCCGRLANPFLFHFLFLQTGASWYEGAESVRRYRKCRSFYSYSVQQVLSEGTNAHLVMESARADTMALLRC